MDELVCLSCSCCRLCIVKLASVRRVIVGVDEMFGLVLLAAVRLVVVVFVMFAESTRNKNERSIDRWPVGEEQMRCCSIKVIRLILLRDNQRRPVTTIERCVHLLSSSNRECALYPHVHTFARVLTDNWGTRTTVKTRDQDTGLPGHWA